MILSLSAIEFMQTDLIVNLSVSNGGFGISWRVRLYVFNRKPLFFNPAKRTEGSVRPCVFPYAVFIVEGYAQFGHEPYRVEP